MASATTPTPNAAYNPTSEAFKLIVLYANAMGTKVDSNGLAKATGLKYKACWDRLNAAKKELAASGVDLTAQNGAGNDPNAAAAANGNGKAAAGKGRKRKAIEEIVDEEGNVKAEPAAKKRGRPAKAETKAETETKVKNELVELKEAEAADGGDEQSGTDVIVKEEY